MSTDARLLVGDGQWLTFADPATGTRPVRVADGPNGVRRQDADTTRPATCFPPEATLATSWDPELVAEVAAAIGREARLLGVDVVLAPGVNLKRSPLCGRNFEYFSEDPLVAGVLGAAYVEGLQSQGVGSSLKHFAVNNQEHRRHSISAEVDERTLRELYLAAFERIVRTSRPWTVMCSYNRVNGTHASQHRRLLTEILRREWGFEGLVVSDWGAVHDPVAAVAAGLDLQMPGDDGTSMDAIGEALETGGLDPAAVATAAERVRRLADRCGQPKAAGEVPDAVADEHDRLARRAATAGAVLLTNTGVLPLAPAPGARIAVLGRQAVEPVFQGGGSAAVVPLRTSALLPALTAAAPAVEFSYAPAYDWEQVADDRRLPGDPHSARAEQLRAEALAVATAADLVIACVGNPTGIESEGYDRPDLALPADQELLLGALAGLDRPVVVVLASGAPVRLEPWCHGVDALLLAGLGGQAGGGAVADILLGAAEPGGRLAETWPLRLSDTPVVPNGPGERGEVRYGEGVFIGYRWYDALERDVAFPFGHGLGYTDIVVTDATAEVIDAEACVVRVRVVARNLGRRPGRTVVQVYVGEDEPLLQRPPRELRGFAGLSVEPGDSAETTIELDGRAFAFFDVISGHWQRQPGTFTISVGTSSRELPVSCRIRLPADPSAPRLVGEDELAQQLQAR